MDHFNRGSDEPFLNEYLKRDLVVRKKNEEAPYAIVRDEIVGRHLVASRDIAAGEVILRESPLTFGPSENTRPLCLGCYEPVGAESPCCQGCGYPMCSATCSERPEHQLNECQILQRNGHKVDRKQINFSGEDPAYSFISLLRALSLRKSHPDLWDLLWMQMSHHESRQKSAFWTKKTQDTVEALLRAVRDLSEEEVKLVPILLGIFLVNDFEINICERDKEFVSSSATSIRAIYALASMPSHSCVTNTCHDFSTHTSGFVMTVRAVVNIKKGQDITHSYTDPWDTILTRRNILYLGKFFNCSCERCREPTEMGTFSSALRCSNCKDGTVLQADISKLDSHWACTQCQNTVSYSQVLSLLTDIKREAERLEPSANYTPLVEEYEQFLRKFGEKLHSNHVYLLDKKYTLAKMYGRMQGYEPDSMTEEQFERKRKLCLEVLAVLDKLMPGRTRKRGMMMYELHLPLVMMANRALQSGPKSGADPKRIKADLKAGLKYLQTAMDILKDEPEGSFELKIVQGSRDSLKQLQDWVKQVCEAL